MPRGAAIQSMFAGIAGRYDLTNRVLSLGMEAHWRRRLVKLALENNPRDIADLATGSGGVAFALKAQSPATRVARLRFSAFRCLKWRRKKQASSTAAEKIPFAFGDCLALPLADAELDALTIAYGVRNFEDRPRGLRELRRVLKPGGRACILEFTQPDRWMRPFYFLYLKTLLPLIAWVTTGDRKAYEYLGGSIASFPTKESFSEELRAAGFREVRTTGLTGCIVALHIATA